MMPRISSPVVEKFPYIKVMDDHILQSRHEIKDADELETFREGFVGLCWLDGPNSLISMLYLSYLM